MRRNQVKNGLTISKNIEITEVVPSKRSIAAYLLQLLMVILLCLSILYCFLTGLGIEVNVLGLNLRVIAFAVLFFVLFLFKPYIKFTLPAVLLLYLLMVYLWWDSILGSFISVANTFIDLYNKYYYYDITELTYHIFEGEITNNTIVYFFSFLLTGFLCYVVLYEKTVILYLVITIPIAFSPLLVGYMPSFLPYLLYIAGTIGILGAIMSEKLGGIPRKAVRHSNSIPLFRVSRSKVAIQYISAAIVILLLIVPYTIYSPERYENEFDGEAIIKTAQEKIDEIVYGDLLEDTIFGEWFGKRVAGGGGINHGKLNTVGELKFKHEVALKVQTEKKENPSPCYLRSYIGEQYNSDHWSVLSEEDQEKLRTIESEFTISDNGESISSAMTNLLIHSPYDLNHYRTNSMSVEIEGANKDNQYMPYNTVNEVTKENGSLKSDALEYQYMEFEPTKEGGSPLSENYRNIDALNLLKLNLVNSSIYEKIYHVPMQEGWDLSIPSEYRNNLTMMLAPYGEEVEDYHQDEFKIPLESVYSGVADLGDTPYFEGNIDVKVDLPLYLNKSEYVLYMGNAITQFNQYAKEENAYFNYVRDVYTKLPEKGLEKVKQLVAGHEVTAAPTVLNGENYTDITQLGGINSVLDTYFSSTRNQNDQDMNRYIREDEDSIQTKYYEAIEYVRNYLAQNTSYTLKPGIAPSRADYVDYFLFENKKGFCVHYATAATVMLRAMGVPARYVEGYVVTPEQYEGVETEYIKRYRENEGEPDERPVAVEMVNIDVKDENAHAWVEVYLPGLGWQPVEMTAPYIYNSNIEIPPVNVDPNATLKPTPTPSATVTPFATPKATPKATVKPTPTISPIGTPSSTGKGNGFFEGLSKWYNGLSSTVRIIIKTILALLVLLLLFIAFVYLRCHIIRKIRARKKKQLTNSEWVLYENIRLDKVLSRFALVYRSSEAYKEFVAEICKQFDFVDEQQALTYYRLLLKARFDKDELSEDDVLTCRGFYDNYMEGLFKQFGKCKKWAYKKRWVL